MKKNANQLYQFDQILDEKWDKNGKCFMLVKWKGYSKNQATWQPQMNIKMYLQNQQTKIKKKQQTKLKKQQTKLKKQQTKLKKQQTKSKKQKKILKKNKKQQMKQTQIKKDKKQYSTNIIIKKLKEDQQIQTNLIEQINVIEIQKNNNGILYHLSDGTICKKIDLSNYQPILNYYYKYFLGRIQNNNI